MGNLDSLPVEIILDILKRLDIDAVIQYRLVSRSWNYHFYHLLLDYLEETHMEFQRQAKEIQLKWSFSGRLDEIKLEVDPMLCVMSICFRKIEEIMEFIKKIMEFFNQDIMDAPKNSGGTYALFEYGKLLLLKNFTDTNLKSYLICLQCKERVECLDVLDCLDLLDCIDEWQRICERKKHLLKKLQEPQNTYLASGPNVAQAILVSSTSGQDFSSCPVTRQSKPMGRLSLRIRVLRQAWRVIVSAGPFAILFIFYFYVLFFL